jgi:uncharacterized protein
LRSFRPLTRNSHLLTILGNYWPRTLELGRFPVERRLFETEPDVRVLVLSQLPESAPRGQIVMVHGLEGSSEAGYARSMAQHALEAGFATHRFNMRSCGGTESLARTNYHAGQTADLLAVLREFRAEIAVPLFLVGFSLGGNVALKLAGELGDAAVDLIAGLCAVSTPIDLAACVERLEHPSNFVYQWRFLNRLKERVRRRARQWPDLYSADGLEEVKTVYEFDDRFTARFFGFGSAANYYTTQASRNFLDAIRVPTLLIQAKDDPLIPFAIFDHPAFRGNPNLELIAPEHGGHLGFLARGKPRFWLDGVVIEWIEDLGRRP